MSLSEALGKAIGGVILFWIMIIVIAIIIFKRNRAEFNREIEQMHQQQNNDQNLNVNQQQDPSINNEAIELAHFVNLKKTILWIIVIMEGIILFNMFEALYECSNSNVLKGIVLYSLPIYYGVIAPAIIVFVSNRISIKAAKELMDKQQMYNQNMYPNQQKYNQNQYPNQQMYNQNQYTNQQFENQNNNNNDNSNM